MEQLRWYLEHFLDYPFDPEIGHAERVLDALQAWGTQAFNALFDRRDAGDWLADSEILQIRSDDPHILSWPWEALFDPQHNYLAHERRIERRLNHLADPPPLCALPNDRVNILLVVARPYKGDVRYRSIARPLVELIHSRGLPAHVDVLRPPTFDQLREHLPPTPATTTRSTSTARYDTAMAQASTRSTCCRGPRAGWSSKTLTASPIRNPPAT